MEDAPFADLHHAAIAGAEGVAAWRVADLPPSPPLSHLHPDHLPPDDLPPVDPIIPAPFVASSPIPILLPRHALQHHHHHHHHHHHPALPSSPPLQSSLTSLSSSAYSPTSLPSLPSLPDSPLSTPNKPLAPASAPPPTLLPDLKGTTAARSRKMSDEERRLMLHKRRLRNRASAARSREKRSRTLIALTADVEHLMKSSARLAEHAEHAAHEARRLRAQNVLLLKENQLLKSQLHM